MTPTLAPALGLTDLAVLAPEIVVTLTALVLLLAAATRGRLRLALWPSGLAAIVLGLLMLRSGAGLAGALAVLVGLALPGLAVALPGRPVLVRAWVAGLGLGAALVLTLAPVVGVVLAGEPFVATVAFSGSFASDGIALMTRITVLVSALIAVPLGHGYLVERGVSRVEFEPLLLLGVVGMTLLGGANDLVTAFMAIELLSISMYVLVALARRDRRSQESGVKYLVLGAVASAVLLYGIALTYVATGSIELAVIGQRVGAITTPAGIVTLGLGLTLVGLGFKVALVPFQLWTPDVYQGAPSNVTAFMAAAVKAAAFAAVLRILLVAFGPLAALWAPVLAVLAAVTMLYGAAAALVQQDVKRILAYSSITHAGYAAIGVVAASDDGLSATLWYLLTYAVSTLAAFGVVIAVERRRRGEVTLVDLRGLGRTSPLAAGLLALALLSLAGIPTTAGFLGKLAVFSAGIEAGWTWLVVIGVVSSVVAAGFYLRIAGIVFLEAPDPARGAPVMSVGLAAAVSVAGLLVLALGLQPQLVLELVADTASILR
jgi:NADH-quinone oxidoreductase subunit N